MHRVVFPNELRLGNTTDDAPCAEFAYGLTAVVVHVGTGPNHGARAALLALPLRLLCSQLMAW